MKKLMLGFFVLCAVFVQAQPPKPLHQKLRDAVEVNHKAPKIKVGNELWTAVQKRCAYRSNGSDCMYTYEGSDKKASLEVYVMFDDNARWEQAQNITNALQSAEGATMTEDGHGHKYLLRLFWKEYSGESNPSSCDGVVVNLSSGVSANYYVRACNGAKEIERIKTIILPSLDEFPTDEKEF